MIFVNEKPCGDSLCHQDAATVIGTMLKTISELGNLNECLWEENGRLRSENSRLHKLLESATRKLNDLQNPSAWVCMYCGATITGNREAVLQHVGNCEKNPLVQEINGLRSRIADAFDVLCEDDPDDDSYDEEDDK